MPTSSSDIAISVRGLGKTYRIEHKVEHFTATEELIARLKNPLRKPVMEEIRVLEDVSFDIERGDVVGIIGRNGAGKSTLFKILSRIVEPTNGEVRIFGRVGSLIEVGTGFQPELTGRENIYLNGSILGMSRREISRRFDEIIDFSGVEQFLDTPVKRYSSGMYVRLAFSVAAHLETDILLVDEVLSVGDGEFQKKSLGKMNEIANAGRTVVFVSHNLEPLQALCNKGIVLDRGHLLKQGTLKEALYEYSCLIRGETDLPDSTGNGTVNFKNKDKKNKYKFFRSIDLLDAHGESTRSVTMGTTVRIRVLIEANQAIENPNFTVAIEDVMTVRALTVKSPKIIKSSFTVDGLCELICDIDNFPLAPGEYGIFLVMTHAERRRGQLRRSNDADDVVKKVSFNDIMKFDETSTELWFNVLDADTFGDGWGFSGGTSVAKADWRLRQIEPAAKPKTG